MKSVAQGGIQKTHIKIERRERVGDFGPGREISPQPIERQRLDIACRNPHPLSSLVPIVSQKRRRDIVTVSLAPLGGVSWRHSIAIGVNNQASEQAGCFAEHGAQVPALGQR